MNATTNQTPGDAPARTGTRPTGVASGATRTRRALLGCVLALGAACERSSTTSEVAEPEAEATPGPAPAAAPSEVVVAPASLLDAVIDRAIEAPPEGGSTYRIDAYVGALIIEQLRRDPMPFSPWRSAAAAPDPARPEAGYRVGPLRPYDAWTRLGFQEGDIVFAINGVSTVEPDWIATALRQAENRVTASVFRDDVSLVLSYRMMGAMAWNDLRSQLAPTAEVVVAEAPGDEPEPEPAEVRSGGSPSAPGSSPAGVGGGGGRKTPTPSSRPGSGGGTSPTAKAVAQCSSDTRCTLDKTYFDSIVRTPSKIESQARIVPAIANDVHSGYKLNAVRPGTAVAQLGFRSGDKVTHINGRDLTNDLEAMQLYMGLSGTRSFNVRYVRGGSTRTKIIDVR